MKSIKRQEQGHWSRLFRVLTIFVSLAIFSGQTGEVLAGSRMQEISLAGVMTVTWGDGGINSEESQGPFYFLTTSDNQSVQVIFSPDVLEAAGGIFAINGNQVELHGVMQVSDSNDTFQAESIELIGTPSQVSVTGSQPWINILCRFGDSTGVTPHPVSWFSGLFANIFPGLDHYWREVSYNKIDLAGTRTVGWFNLPKARSAYLKSDGWLNLGLILQDCTKVADAKVYFPDYVGINMMFNGQLDGYAWGGGWYINLDGITQVWHTTWLPPWGYENQSPLAHEMGHGFGLPHSSGPYNATYDSQWDVMSSTWACDTIDPNYRCLAEHTISYHMNFLGWIDASRKMVYSSTNAGKTIHLANLAVPTLGATDTLMIQIPTPGGLYYYTVESRLFKGYDATAAIPGEAVIIHKVTPGQDRPARVVDLDRNGDPNDARAMWIPGETFFDEQNQLAVSIMKKTANGFDVVINKPVQLNALSIGPYDGYIVESGVDTHLGGPKYPSGSLIVGDNKANRQICSILSFDTGGLPDTGKVISAKLSLRSNGTTGDPSGLGNFWLDAIKGLFSGNINLQSGDYEFPATGEDIARLLPSGETFTASVGSKYINLVGPTQFRVCNADDDGDLTTDYQMFYSGDATNSSYRPKLGIWYTP